MTTIIGIKTNLGDDAIVLAADRQLSEYLEGEMTKKSVIKKLHCGDFWVMGDVGDYNSESNKVYSYLRGQRRYDSSPEKARTTLESAIRENYFEMVNRTNTAIMKKEDNIDSTNSFILAINSPKIGLWRIDEFGNLKRPEDSSQIEYICIGSGSEKVRNYIEEQIATEKIDKDKIRTREAIKICKGAMVASEKDPDTGQGYDLIVLSKDRIMSYGAIIKKALEEAEERKLEEICSEWDEKGS